MVRRKNWDIGRFGCGHFRYLVFNWKGRYFLFWILDLYG